MKGADMTDLNQLVRCAREGESLVGTVNDSTNVAKQLQEIKTQMALMNDKISTAPAIQVASAMPFANEGAQQNTGANYTQPEYTQPQYDERYDRPRQRTNYNVPLPQESRNYTRPQRYNPPNNRPQSNYRTPAPRFQNRAPYNDQRNQNSTACYRCAGVFQHVPRQCPAEQMTCYGCRRQGHVIRACQSRQS
jgi:hypothetical protein